MGNAPDDSLYITSSTEPTWIQTVAPTVAAREFAGQTPMDAATVSMVAALQAPAFPIAESHDAPSEDHRFTRDKIRKIDYLT